MSGGPGGAEAGTLTVMMGGDDITVNRVKPLIECFSTNIVHFGGVGKKNQLFYFFLIFLSVNCPSCSIVLLFFSVSFYNAF